MFAVGEASGKQAIVSGIQALQRLAGCPNKGDNWQTAAHSELSVMSLDSFRHIAESRSSNRNCATILQGKHFIISFPQKSKGLTDQ